MTPEPRPSHQWMAEFPILQTTGRPLHFVPTGTDPEGWKDAPVGAWVAACGTPVGPFWREDQENEALAARSKHDKCVTAERHWLRARRTVQTGGKP